MNEVNRENCTFKADSFHVVVCSNEELSREMAEKYVDYLEKKYKRKVKELYIEFDGDDAKLDYEFEPVPFERIRRITGK